jgi:hypothetical protein
MTQLSSCKRMVCSSSKAANQPQTTPLAYHSFDDRDMHGWARGKPPTVHDTVNMCNAQYYHHEEHLISANFYYVTFTAAPRDHHCIMVDSIYNRRSFLCSIRPPVSNPIMWQFEKQNVPPKLFFLTLFRNLLCFSSYPHHSTIPQPNNFIRD